MSKTQVHAETINKVQFTFECPYCYTKYRKDGKTPYKTAKKSIHYHGSGYNTNNRNESRIAHCNKRIYNGEFEIIIDDSTLRN